MRQIETNTKSRSRHVVREIMQRRGYDPIEELVDIAQNSTSSEIKFEVAKTLAPYMYPKLNAMTVTQDTASPVEEKEVNMLNLVFASPELRDAAHTIGIAHANQKVKQLIESKTKGIEDDQSI